MLPSANYIFRSKKKNTNRVRNAIFFCPRFDYHLKTYTYFTAAQSIPLKIAFPNCISITRVAGHKALSLYVYYVVHSHIQGKGGKFFSCLSVLNTWMHLCFLRPHSFVVQFLLLFCVRGGGGGERSNINCNKVSINVGLLFHMMVIILSFAVSRKTIQCFFERYPHTFISVSYGVLCL